MSDTKELVLPPWKLALLPNGDFIFPHPLPGYVDLGLEEILRDGKDGGSYEDVVDLEIRTAAKALAAGDFKPASYLIRDASIISIVHCGGLDPLVPPLFEYLMFREKRPSGGLTTSELHMRDVIGYCDKNRLLVEATTLRLARARGAVQAISLDKRFFGPGEVQELLGDLARVRRIANQFETSTLPAEALELMRSVVSGAVKRAMKDEQQVGEGKEAADNTEAAEDPKIAEAKREERLALVSGIMHGAFRHLQVDPAETFNPDAFSHGRFFDAEGLKVLTVECQRLVDERGLSPEQLGLARVLGPATSR